MRLDCHAVAGLGVGHGVANDVAQDLRESIGVCLERSVDPVQLEVALAEQGKVALEVLEEVAQVDRLWLDELAGLGLVT